MRRQRRVWTVRERKNVFEIFDDTQLIKRYWMDRAGIIFVTDLVRDVISPSISGSNAISAELKEAMTLRFLATRKMPTIKWGCSWRTEKLLCARYYRNSSGLDFWGPHTCLVVIIKSDDDDGPKRTRTAELPQSADKSSSLKTRSAISELWNKFLFLESNWKCK